MTAIEWGMVSISKSGNTYGWRPAYITSDSVMMYSPASDKRWIEAPESVSARYIPWHAEGSWRPWSEAAAESGVPISDHAKDAWHPEIAMWEAHYSAVTL